jgi:hypothetical protein
VEQVRSHPPLELLIDREENFIPSPYPLIADIPSQNREETTSAPEINIRIKTVSQEIIFITGPLTYSPITRLSLIRSSIAIKIKGRSIPLIT